MWSAVEIIIVATAGILSLAFLGWYFYSSSKKSAKCHGCQAIQMEDIKKYLKQKQAVKKKAKDSPVNKKNNFN